MCVCVFFFTVCLEYSWFCYPQALGAEYVAGYENIFDVSELQNKMSHYSKGTKYAVKHWSTDVLFDCKVSLDVKLNQIQAIVKGTHKHLLKENKQLQDFMIGVEENENENVNVIAVEENENQGET